MDGESAYLSLGSGYATNWFGDLLKVTEALMTLSHSVLASECLYIAPGHVQGLFLFNSLRQLYYPSVKNHATTKLEKTL